MTVNSISDRIVYLTDGATTQFSFNFAVPAPENITVFITDSHGTTSLLSPGSYTLVINPPAPPNPTPVGGMVTYPISGPAVGTGSQISIIRSVEPVQQTSLANQGTLYPAVIEQELDYLTMLAQQLGDVNDRALVVPPEDPIPAPLPPVLLRAGQAAIFDAQGNLVAGTPPAGGVTISPAMQPVVGAGTLPAARTAMGLGVLATLGIGTGLQNDGAGNLRANVGIRNVTSNQTPGASLDESVDITTGSLVYTLLRANTLFNGFGYYVNCISGSVTFTPNAADKIQGLATGVSWAIAAGTNVFIQTDGVNTWYLRYYKTPDPTSTSFISGSGSYIPPVGVSRVRVQMCAGGGGGGGGDGGGFTGGPGGNTSFGTWTTVGGQGGRGSVGASGGSSSIGGTGGTNGTGTLVARVSGGDGGTGLPWITPIDPNSVVSGAGGGSFFGGGGAGTFGGIAAGLGKAYGSGAGGGGNGGGNTGTGGGGAGGEYVVFWQSMIGVSSVAYAVGAGGIPGATTGKGGIIIVEEFYGGP